MGFLFGGPFKGILFFLGLPLFLEIPIYADVLLKTTLVWDIFAEDF